ncbi:hypothetical protein V5J73_13315 [Flavobacterium sp. KS-LB2]|uniref:hypothetical protein n=1 Tax=Flavobacterium sp. KS-LB2 TaxID=3120525 RepID=UPI0030CBD5B6
MTKDVLTFIFFLFPLFFITSLFVFFLSYLVKSCDVFITYRIRSFIKREEIHGVYYTETLSDKKRFYFLPLIVFSCLVVYHYIVFRKILKIDYIFLDDFKYNFCVVFCVIVFIIASVKTSLFEGINTDKMIAVFIASYFMIFGYYTISEHIEYDRKRYRKTENSISEEKLKASKIESADLQIKIYEIEEKTKNLEVALDDLYSEISDVSIENYDSSMQNVHSKLSDVEGKLNELKSDF